MPPRRCSPHPMMLGHAGMQTPGSPLRVPVSISVNRGGPRALTQRGLELSLEHRGSAEINPEGFGEGEAQGRPPRGAPPSRRHGRTQALIYARERCPFSCWLPPGCCFKHANLSNHLSAPKFSEKIKACEPAGLFFPAALGEAAGCPLLLLPACFRWQLVAVPAD